MMSGNRCGSIVHWEESCSKPLTHEDVEGFGGESGEALEGIFSDSELLQIIHEASGNILDPAVVDVFFESLDLLQQVKEKWAD